MRKSTRRELAKSRELIHFLLDGKCCFFCHELLNPNHNKVKRGDSDGSPVARNITQHHVNGNHDDDRRRNLRLAHTSCHKSFHMKKLWIERKLTGKKTK